MVLRMDVDPGARASGPSSLEARQLDRVRTGTRGRRLSEKRFDSRADRSRRVSRPPAPPSQRGIVGPPMSLPCHGSPPSDPRTGGREIPHPGDLALARDAARGEEQARATLSKRLESVPRMLQARNKQLGGRLSGSDLEDITQDVLLVLWRKLPDYRGEASLETWAYRMGNLELMNGLRRRNARERHTELKPEEERPEFEDTGQPAHSGLESADLYEGLARLPRTQYDVIRAKFYRGLSFREIGAEAGYSTSMAKTHFYEGMRELNRILRRGLGEHA